MSLDRNANTEFADRADIQALGKMIARRWPGCMFGTQPGSPDPQVIFGGEAQAFIARGPFDEMATPVGPGSFYVHADAPTEFAALLLVFARAVTTPPIKEAADEA